MSIKITPLRRLALGALVAVLAAPLPALAQNHGGGGGHAAAGGHGSFGGGGHAAAGGRGSFGGGHGAGRAAVGGYSGHGYGGAYGGALPGRSYGYSGGARGFVGGQHFAPSGRVGYAGGYSRGGYSRGGGYYHRPYWGGGYWGGFYWPRAWYGPGFAWFLPVLPLAYATYWWDSVPYYYANDVYYTWNPSYNGYVVTDPPPVGDGSAPVGAAPDVAADQVYLYPKNGQSDAQQATDRGECQQWAASQAGAGAGNDYHRAFTACAEARGYSVR